MCPTADAVNVVLGWRRKSSAMRKKSWSGSFRKRPDRATLRRPLHQAFGPDHSRASDLCQYSMVPLSEQCRQSTCRYIPQCKRSVDSVNFSITFVYLIFSFCYANVDEGIIAGPPTHCVRVRLVMVAGVCRGLSYVPLHSGAT